MTLEMTTTQAQRRRTRVRHSGEYLVSHRKLLLRVTKSELSSRYAGSILGLGWTIVYPVLFLGIYATVYLYIFRFSPKGLTSSQYALYIIAGLVPYMVTAEALSAGVTAVVANKAVLTNVVFPIDLVPAKAVLLGQPTMIVGSAILLLGSVVTGTVSWMLLLAPVVWILQVLALIGAAWVLSLLNVVLRDLTHGIALVLLLLLIASPIAYTPEMVPQQLRIILAINPFAYFVVAYQELIVLGQLPTAVQLAGLLITSTFFFVLGGWIFAATKRVVLDYV
jgi:lipopolysaccharide transport system permease protein